MSRRRGCSEIRGVDVALQLLAVIRAMALHRYFAKASVPTGVSTLSQKELGEANASVKRIQEEKVNLRSRSKYIGYTPEERALIGKYAAENGTTNAVRHLSQVMSKKIPESTARRLKSEYLQKLKEVTNSARGTDRDDDETGDENTVPLVKTLPTKVQGRPLLLGENLDRSVQEYIKALRAVGGDVNTAIVQAAAVEIVGARDPGLLREHGGHIKITKLWAKSILKRMGFVKFLGVSKEF